MHYVLVTDARYGCALIVMGYVASPPVSMGVGLFKLLFLGWSFLLYSRCKVKKRNGRFWGRIVGGVEVFMVSPSSLWFIIIILIICFAS